MSTRGLSRSGNRTIAGFRCGRRGGGSNGNRSNGQLTLNVELPWGRTSLDLLGLGDVLISDCGGRSTGCSAGAGDKYLRMTHGPYILL